MFKSDFAVACSDGDLQMVKYIYYKKVCSPTEIRQGFMITSSYNDRLEIIKWMIDKCEIRQYDINWAFENACRIGYLETAKYLLPLTNININECDNLLFRNSSLNIMQWLMTFINVDIHMCDNFIYRYAEPPTKKWLLTIDAFHKFPNDPEDILIKQEIIDQTEKMLKVFDNTVLYADIQSNIREFLYQL
jgi:hypothetical protein